jgi:hypothetical protein
MNTTTMEKEESDLHDRTIEHGRSKSSVIVDTAMKTARRKVSRAEVLTKRNRENVPPPAEKNSI